MNSYISVMKFNLNRSEYKIRLNKLQILLVVFFSTIFCGYSQNIIQIDNGTADLNDTIEIHIRISNDQAFIAFQLDVLIPESFSYIDNSAQLSGRENGHTLTTFKLSDTLLRFISYSTQNNFFTGDTGRIVSYNAFSGNIMGIFDLKIQNAIIADSLSQNIMDQSIDATWLIGFVGITETKRYSNVNVYPNPGRQEEIRIYIEVQKPGNVQVQLLNNICQLMSTRILYLPEGENYFSLRDIVEDRIIHHGLYFLDVTFINSNTEIKHLRKLIITD